MQELGRITYMALKKEITRFRHWKQYHQPTCMDLNRSLYNQDGSENTRPENLHFYREILSKKMCKCYSLIFILKDHAHVCLKNWCDKQALQFGSGQPFEGAPVTLLVIKENMNHQWLQWFQANYEYALRYLYSCNNTHYNARHRLQLLYSLFDLKIVLRSKNAWKIQLQFSFVDWSIFHLYPYKHTYNVHHIYPVIKIFSLKAFSSPMKYFYCEPVTHDRFELNQFLTSKRVVWDFWFFTLIQLHFVYSVHW